MREIKFRIWDGHTKSFFDTPATHYLPTLKVDKNGIMTIETKDESYDLMQYTGLKDKNGKEIYEGDIIAFVGKYWTDKSAMTTEVKFENGAFMPFWEIDGTDDGLSFLDEYENRFEVIGNKWENHELIALN
jgi:uncharacterized phage protein (TIGR01671 family)